MCAQIVVLGAGLAGSEAAWQLAERGHDVSLMEMRPGHLTPAHSSGQAAELVCSNSFKSEDPFSATGILKAEMTRLNSLVLSCAYATRVPAGMSLAVDREAFSSTVSARLSAHPRVHWSRGRQESLGSEGHIILATGPLTSGGLSDWITRACGREHLHFYDAIAPIVERDSINLGTAFRASRYGKGEPDFINCPMDPVEYDGFLAALLAAPRTPLHDFETRFFEACLPIEVMADRGPDTLRFGPMKPVGLTDPRTGRRPHAVVQLRQDSLAGEHFNLVGFQTRLTWGAQRQVFRLIPGLESAEFVRYGSIHRNTYIQAPVVLGPTLEMRSMPNIRIAGQLAGVEGYLESAACGLASALYLDQELRLGRAVALPADTVIGALLHYITHADPTNFAPVNAMLGILPDLPAGCLDCGAIKRSGGARALKTEKGRLHRERSLASLDNWITHCSP